MHRFTNIIILVVAALFQLCTPFAYAGVVLSDDGAAKLTKALGPLKAGAAGPALVDDMMFQQSVVGIKGFTPGNRWPSANIPVQFDAGLDASKRNAFMNACALWNPAGIRCVARTNETNFVAVAQHSGEQCSGINVSCSFVGMIGGGQKLYVSINHWGYTDVVAHEIGHALGLIHEQMRSDRDNNIQVFLQNAIDGSAPQFNPVGGRLLSAYDFKSIMHYDPCAFQRFADCYSNFAHRVIEVKHCRYKEIPQKTGVPTANDIFSIKTLYQIPGGVDPGANVPPFEPVKIECGPSCRTVGTTKYGRVNYVERKYYMPPVPNPTPTLEGICRSLGQSALPASAIQTTGKVGAKLVLTVKGDCGCANTLP